MVGRPAGPSLATGKIIIIVNPRDLVKFREKEISLSDAIDPNMTFIVPLTSGIVERCVGTLIQGAIIARAYGIPGVSCASEATKIICTGDTVTVEGFIGIIIG